MPSEGKEDDDGAMKSWTTLRYRPVATRMVDCEQRAIMRRIPLLVGNEVPAQGGAAAG